MKNCQAIRDGGTVPSLLGHTFLRWGHEVHINGFVNFQLNQEELIVTCLPLDKSGKELHSL